MRTLPSTHNASVAKTKKQLIFIIRLAVWVSGCVNMNSLPLCAANAMIGFILMVRNLAGWVGLLIQLMFFQVTIKSLEFFDFVAKVWLVRLG